MSSYTRMPGMLLVSVLFAAAFFVLDIFNGASIPWALLHAWLVSQAVLITLAVVAALSASNLLGRIFAWAIRATAIF